MKLDLDKLVLWFFGLERFGMMTCPVCGRICEEDSQGMITCLACLDCGDQFKRSLDFSGRLMWVLQPGDRMEYQGGRGYYVLNKGRTGVTDKGPNADQIAKRAYEIFLARGDRPGSELEDWYRAEQELLAKFKAARRHRTMDLE